MRRPWLPAGPGDGSDVKLAVLQNQRGPAFSLRSRQPPMPIISLNAGQPGKALSAAWTMTTPPPLVTYCSKDAFKSAGQRSSGAS